ncbi:MAG: DUF3078 domain-containing protein [Calditrichaeota bacterium]|nr:DUF3078 domain-containing protein [Calditrichota bacterium]
MYKFLTGIFLLLVATSLAVRAQEKEAPKFGWQKSMVAGLNLTQTSFDNWTQGGENSFAWQANLNFKFVDDQEKWNWSNTGKFNYGSTKIGDEEMKKSIDEIKLETVYTYKIGKLLNPFAAATGETQFAPGYNYGNNTKAQISAFMDPGYFRESAGIGYKPNETIQTRLGGAMKQTVTRNYPSPYADDPSTIDTIEKIKNEIGLESVTDLNLKVSENSLLTSKLELFSTLTTAKEVDVNWDTIFTTKISKYFSVNFNFKLFYDRDISVKRQIKQAIALGFTYNLL